MWTKVTATAQASLRADAQDIGDIEALGQRLFCMGTDRQKRSRGGLGRNFGPRGSFLLLGCSGALPTGHTRRLPLAIATARGMLRGRRDEREWIQE